MANRTRKQAKGRNGVGDSVTVFFDESDPAERRALEAARLLAVKHGRRKSAIVALLEAVYAHYEQTGELMSSAEISGALMGQAARSSVGIAQASRLPLGEDMLPQPRVAKEMTAAQRKTPKRRSGSIEITKGSKVSTQKVAENFISSMKGLASGFFD